MSETEVSLPPLPPRRRRSPRTVQLRLRRVQEQLDQLLGEVGLLEESLVLPSLEERREQLDEEAPATLDVVLAGLLTIVTASLEHALADTLDALEWTPAKRHKAWQESQNNKPFAFAPEDLEWLRGRVMKHRNPGEEPREA